MKLRIAPGLELPLEAVTQTFGVLAKRGSGKSNAAAVMAEAMYDADLPFVVVDPVGAWWGLRSSRDGKSEGLAIPIFGGYRGDVPLEPSAGKLIADVVVDERLSCVLDVSAFESEGAKRRFLADFAERLFRRKGQPGNEDPLHLFLEEADDYAPQKAGGVDVNRTLGAFQRIVKQGRARGLGATMITQRSAVLNKDVLTQIETLVVLRTTSPNDRKAIGGWVEYHGQAKEILASLHELRDGEAWVWSPWLDLTKRVQFPRRRTFDSGSTPAAQGGTRRVARLADVDLSVIETQMKETLERAKAEDPKELRREIADLRHRLAVQMHEPITRVERVEVPVLTEENLKALESIQDRAFSELDRLEGVGEKITEAIYALVNPVTLILSDVDAKEHGLKTSPAPRAGTKAEGGAGSGGPRTPAPSAVGDLRLSKSQQKLLDALAWFEAIDVTPRRPPLAAVAGSSSKSSGFEKNLSTLRTAGLIDYPSPARVSLTDAGQRVANYPEARPTTDALQEAVYSMVSSPQAQLLRVLVAAYPNALSREELADRAGVSAASSGFEKNISTLRSFELIDYPARGQVAALPVLFLEEAA